MALINETAWPKDWSPDLLIDAVQTGNRIGLRPLSAKGELEKLRKNLPEIMQEIRKLRVDQHIIDRVLHHLGDLR
jgi:hypothetical protein